MKLKLTLAKMTTPAFIGGFRTLRKSRFGRAEAWAIYKTGEQIDRELERYVAIRKEIEERFAQSDGKTKFIPKESVSAFQKEVEELGTKEIELWLDHKISFPEECLIEPDELGALVEAGLIDPPDTAKSEPPASNAPANVASHTHDGEARKPNAQPQA